MSSDTASYRLLTIQSHVATGYVGWDVDAVNTVQFSNHTGYGRWGGLRFDAAHLADVFSNMERNKLLRHNRLLTGYTPSPEALGEVEKLIRAQREKNPHMVYLLDPVMGDMDRGMYVNPDVLPIYRRMLHLASIICPNQFEAQVLSGIEICSIATLKAALTKLHVEYQVPHVLITSLELDKDDLTAIGAMPSMPDGKPAMLLVGSTWNTDTKELQPWFLQFPSLGEYFSGVGDLFSALTVARFMEHEEDVPAPARAAYDGYDTPVEGECTLPIARAVTLAVASLQQVLIRTARAMETLGKQEGLDPLQPSHLATEEDRVKIMRMRELRIIQSAGDILHPQQSALENLSKEDVSVDETERRKTMELLWRLETGEGVLSDESSDVEHDHDTKHDSDASVGGDANELLSRLSLSDHERFQSLLRDPSRAARMYFEDEEDVPLWWTERTTLDGTANSVREIEKLGKANVPVRADLRFNVVAVLLAYAYALRHSQLSRLPAETSPSCMCRTEAPKKPAHAPAENPPPARVPDIAPLTPLDDDSDGEPPPLEDAEVPVPTSPNSTRINVPDTPSPPPLTDIPQADPDAAAESDETREALHTLLRRLLPFVFAHPRTSPKLASTMLASVDDAGLYFLHMLGPNDVGSSAAALLATLLRDVRPLLTPPNIRDASDAPVLVYALGDLAALLGACDRAVAKKLAFYAHAYTTAPREAQLAVSVQLDAEIARLEKEHEDAEQLAHLAAANATVGRMDPRVQRMGGGPKIQVLE
ncbi:pyridoxal kinase [Malassezia brasiliensis]|uniref:pyridoxal kinase n=1 Tax=Malassezia brasiliensis TaxID=1821822 RepID=A0AAF0DSF8_9BASI|nr:pyridoxal kinase [Malassezia brasiliensis]